MDYYKTSKELMCAIKDKLEFSTDFEVSFNGDDFVPSLEIRKRGGSERREDKVLIVGDVNDDEEYEVHVGQNVTWYKRNFLENLIGDFEMGSPRKSWLTDAQRELLKEVGQVGDMPFGIDTRMPIDSQPQYPIAFCRPKAPQYVILYAGNLTGALDIVAKAKNRWPEKGRFDVIFGTFGEKSLREKLEGLQGSRVYAVGNDVALWELFGLSYGASCDMDEVEVARYAPRDIAKWARPQYIRYGLRYFALNTDSYPSYVEMRSDEYNRVFNPPKKVRESGEWTEPSYTKVESIVKRTGPSNRVGVYDDCGAAKAYLAGTIIGGGKRGKVRAIEKLLDTWFSPSDKKRIKLWVGAGLMRLHGCHRVNNHCLTIVGPPDCGKTKLLNDIIFKGVFGTHTAIPADYLKGSRFTGQMHMRAYWYVDDACSQTDSLTEARTHLKQLVANSALSFEGKGVDAFEGDICQSIAIISNPSATSYPILIDYAADNSTADKAICLWIDEKASDRIKVLCRNAETPEVEVKAEIPAFAFECEKMANDAYWERGANRWVQDAYYDWRYQELVSCVEDYPQFVHLLESVGLTEKSDWRATIVMDNLESHGKKWKKITKLVTLGKELNKLADWSKKHPDADGIVAKMVHGTSVYSLRKGKPKATASDMTCEFFS